MSERSGNERDDWSPELRAFVAEAPLEREPIAEFLGRAAAKLPPGARVADVGAGRAPYRELFAHTDYFTIDREVSLHGGAESFDVVASASQIPLADLSLDAIVCTQVLEHVPNPAEVLREFRRLLKPMGQLLLSAPLAWEEHEMPFDFYRYTRSGLEHLLREARFDHIEIAPRSDCFETLSQLVRNARWSLGEPTDEQAEHRLNAFRRLDELAGELLEFSPLDARSAFPLGYQVSARATADEVGTQDADREDLVGAPSVRSAARAGTPLAATAGSERIPILYLAPWVDLGGSDKGTIDWFKNIDRERWAPSIITTQPSSNRWLSEIEPYAEEVWSLPDVAIGGEFPAFILGFIETRRVQIVHMMNSRLAFDLMPDMTCLPELPVVVVQHHAEEVDRSGYVRYVASRYGNLVDTFSVTSEQLATAMLDYDVARSRIRVITTGVDAAEEFNPDRVEPFEELAGDEPRILWPGRLVAQKDPLLTLQIVALLHERGVRFVLHIVGDGDMKPELKRRAQELGVARLIEWHPPSHEMARWYRSCALLLMTSTFEGVPYVIYEALAMGMPVVAPALPGNVELMGDFGGELIDPRDDVVAYADAVERLLLDERRRAAIGAQARARMLAEHSLSRAIEQHERLYEHLLNHRREREVNAGCPREPELPALPAPVRFPREPPPPRSVAVIVPCYQHGRFLPEAIASLHAQTLQPERIVVVDDASADSETSQVLDELDRDPLVTVIRLAVNSGPSVARNRALAEIGESYVLPLDADDILLPGALEAMVEQIERAPASTGFIYPNVQHFGNRHDYYPAPAYNLDVLLSDNYCAATTLFDRRVFDAGLRYPEDIVFGHEDWDLVLQMAERRIYGEPAEVPTFMYRKRGFSRVNAVHYGPDSFHKQIELRHPALYGRRERIKAEWAPALSVVLLAQFDGVSGRWAELERQLAAQSCQDFETICVASELDAAVEGVRLLDAGAELNDLVGEAVRVARGRFVVLAGGGVRGGLARATFVESMIRTLWNEWAPAKLVLGVDPARQRPRFASLPPEHAARARPCAVAWRRNPEDDSLVVELGAARFPIEDFILRWQLDGPLAWRSI